MAFRPLVMIEAYIEGEVGHKIWNNQKYEIIGDIVHPDTGKNMEYRHLIKDTATSATWTQSTAN